MKQTTQSETTFKYLLSVEDAARALSLGRTNLYKLLQQREIFSVKVGRLRLVPVRELEAFVTRKLEQQHKGVA